MKRFISIFACALIFLFVFAFCGGLSLFDLHQHVYGWIFLVALIATFVIWAFLRLSDQIDALQKRVDALEKAQSNAE